LFRGLVQMGTSGTLAMVAGEPGSAGHRHPLRALAAAGAWALGLTPAALGLQQCSFARLFHRPCPGCGMTRAVRLLLAGDWRASLHMHPLAIPMLVAGGAFALSTVWTTFLYGMPLVHRSRLARASIAALVVVYVAAIALWIMRWAGLFGGPVPVYS
jgi:Protein of unknown function (DUF2752)